MEAEGREPFVKGPGARAAPPEDIAVFVNTGSRIGQESFEAVQQCLRGCGARVVDSRAVDDPLELPGLVRAALERGVGRILVGGGDGTLSLAAGELAGKDVRMGVLPLGTGNDFARSLHIPPSIEEACRAAVSGEVRRVDLGVANGRAFLNAASIGLSSAVTRKLSNDLKKRLGRAAFAFVAAGEALAHRPFRVTLEVEGQTRTYDTHQVVVGNGRYHGGGQLLSPDATHEDSLLDVYVIGATQSASVREEDAATTDRLRDLWNLFRVATLLSKGRHIDHESVEHVRVRQVRIVAEPHQEVDVDGELLGETPVQFEVRPSALQVLVPRRSS